MSGVDHLPWWKTGRELGLFVVGAVAGVLLPPDDSSIWLGVPVLAIVAIWVYLWRVNARARLSWAATAFGLARTFVGGYFTGLVLRVVQGWGEEELLVQSGRAGLMLLCLFVMAGVHVLERWAQLHEDD